MRNEKGEDWGKYMEELNKLQPLLRREMAGMGQQDYQPILSKDGIPLNDPTVKKREKNEVFSADGKVMNKQNKKEKFAIVGKSGEVLSSTKMKREQAVANIKGRREKIAKFMQNAINVWISGEMQKILNNVEWRAAQEGQRWPIKKKRIYIDIKHKKDPLPLGSDMVSIYKKKKLIAQQLFVWEYDDEN